MIPLQSIATTREDDKRSQIRNYFAKPNLAAPIIVLILGILLLLAEDVRIVGFLVVLGGGIWLYFTSQSKRSTPSDQNIDAWFREDMQKIKTRSLERLNLEESQLIQGSLVITGPILWEVKGIPKTETVWKKGKDEHVRFSVNDVTIIHLTDSKLSSYQCNYNFIRGASVNERDDEYYYKDVIAVSTREESTNYTLPNNQIMKQAQSFTLSVSSGERISVIISSSDIVKLTGGEVVDTGVDHAIKAIRKVLGEKKL